MGSAPFVLTSLAFIFPVYVLLKRILIFTRSGTLSSPKALVEIDLIFSGLIPAILLEATFFGRHFWPHYIQFFAPFVALSLSLSIAYLASKHIIKLSTDISHRLTLAIVILLLVLFTKFEIATSFRNVKPHSDAALVQNVKKLLADRRLNGQATDFLHVNSMYLHWKLAEPRHGFPHAANIEHINWGWFSNLNKNNMINLYTTSEELCQAFQNKGPSIVFIERNSLSYPCFSSPNSLYSSSENYPEIPSKDAVFIRK